MKRESSAHTVKLVFCRGKRPPDSSEPAVGAQKKLPGNVKFCGRALSLGHYSDSRMLAKSPDPGA
jgi:hypothetical protein